MERAGDRRALSAGPDAVKAAASGAFASGAFTAPNAAFAPPYVPAPSGVGPTRRAADRRRRHGATAPAYTSPGRFSPDATAGSIHMTSQMWPSGSAKLRPYMNPWS